MKKIVLISGTMGVGKSTVTKELSKNTENSVYLDGDWCWMINPFVANAENKAMVIKNIQYLLNSFIDNSMIKTIFFCWVMDEQEIVDILLDGINGENIDIRHISIVASQKWLKKNFEKDIDAGIRTYRDFENSLAKLPKYDSLLSEKVDSSDKSISAIVKIILKKI